MASIATVRSLGHCIVLWTRLHTSRGRARNRVVKLLMTSSVMMMVEVAVMIVVVEVTAMSLWR